MTDFHGPSVYADQVLTRAIRILAVGSGDVRSRLLTAYSDFNALTPLHFPEGLRQDFEWVTQQLTKRGPKLGHDGEVKKGSVEWTLQNIRCTTGVKIAQRLVFLQEAVERYVRSRGE